MGNISGGALRLALIAPGGCPSTLHPAAHSVDSSLYFYLFGSIALTIALIAWLSLVSIRRQLRPLELLTQATQHVSQRNFEAFPACPGTMSWGAGALF